MTFQFIPSAATSTQWRLMQTRALSPTATKPAPAHPARVLYRLELRQNLPRPTPHGNLVPSSGIVEGRQKTSRPSDDVVSESRDKISPRVQWSNSCTFCVAVNSSAWPIYQQVSRLTRSYQNSPCIHHFVQQPTRVRRNCGGNVFCSAFPPPPSSEFLRSPQF